MRRLNWALISKHNKFSTTIQDVEALQARDGSSWNENKDETPVRDTCFKFQCSKYIGTSKRHIF